jgi:hypothetical protein
MLSLSRPAPHPDFDKASKRHTDELRTKVAAGAVLASSDFKTLWSKREHKATLVGKLNSPAKCAWCERHREWNRELDVEHYRPKAGVTRWDGTPSLYSDTPPREVSVSDKGYWWLAYEWHNYSLACAPCNQHWKRNLFPMRDPRLPILEGEEASEVPLLIDPMSSFRTADHFKWTSEGVMEAKSDAGFATIVTCGLNRTALLALRMKTAKIVLGELVELKRSLHNENRRSHLLALRALCAPDAEFAGMNRWWVEHNLGWTWERLSAVAV